METALVTGGAGFMGSHLADELIKKGMRVIVLDDLSGGFKENVPEKADFIEGSINDTELISSIFKNNKIDYVYHLAAYAAEGLSPHIRKFNYENNLVGSVNLINESVKSKIKCFVFTSSIAVYGENQLPMTESLTPQPEDPYGISKYAVELDLKDAHKRFGLKYVIFRPHNVYGERQNIGDKYRNVLGIFMNRIMRDEPLLIFGDGKQTRAFSHISDVAPIIADSVFNEKAYQKTFNIGADKPYTVNYLAEEIIKAMKGTDSQHTIQHEPPRQEVVHAFSDHSLVEEILGYKATIELSDGIKRMADWAKQHGPKESSDFDNIEIEEGLPPSWQKKKKEQFQELTSN